MALEDRDRALLDRASARRRRPGRRRCRAPVEAGEEACALGLPAAPPSGRRRRRRRASARPPSRSSTSSPSSASQSGVSPPAASSRPRSRPRLPELLVADVAAELGLLAQRRLDRLRSSGSSSARIRDDSSAGVLLDRALDRTHRRVDRPDEEDRDVLAVETLRGERRIGALDEVLGRLLTPLESSALALAASTCSSRPAILRLKLSRSASSTKPRPEMPTPTRIPTTSTRKTAASDATW